MSKKTKVKAKVKAVVKAKAGKFKTGPVGAAAKDKMADKKEAKSVAKKKK